MPENISYRFKLFRILLLVMPPREWFITEQRKKFLDSITNDIFYRTKSKGKKIDKKTIRKRVHTLLDSRTKINYQFLSMLSNKKRDYTLRDKIMADYFENYKI